MEILLYLTFVLLRLDFNFAVLGTRAILDGNCIQGMYIGIIRKKHNSLT